MSSINFRPTGRSYSAEYQRADGFGYETRYYRRADAARLATRYGWTSPDDVVPAEGWTIAEAMIVGGIVRPYRVAGGMS